MYYTVDLVLQPLNCFHDCKYTYEVEAPASMGLFIIAASLKTTSMMYASLISLKQIKNTVNSWSLAADSSLRPFREYTRYASSILHTEEGQ